MLNTYIELIISLLFIYAMLSTLVSLMNEIYRNHRRDRGRMLYNYVYKMMNDGKNLDLAYLTFRHPLIDNSRKDKTNKPSYVDPKVFATAFIQTVGNFSIKTSYTHNGDGTYAVKEERLDDPIARFKTAVKAFHPTPLKSALLGMVERAELAKEDSYDNLELQVIEWFNNQMNVLSQHYRNKQRRSLLVFASIVTIFLNVDSIHLIHELRKDPALRASLVTKAETYNDKYEKTSAKLYNIQSDTNAGELKTLAGELRILVDGYKDVKKEVVESELPIGYGYDAAPVSWFVFNGNVEYKSNYDRRRNAPEFLGIVFYIFGMCISAFSLSMGAPFWFDLINKAVNLKRGGK